MKSIKLVILLLLASKCLSQDITDSLTLKPSKFGWGVELGPCTGGCYSTKESKKFIENGCFGSILINMNYSRLTHMLRFGGISASIKNDFPSDPKWTAKNDLNSMNLELLTGYKLINSTRINFTPYFGGYTTRFNTQEGSDIIAKSQRTVNITGGTIVELKFNPPETRKSPFKYQNIKKDIYYWYIKLYTGYYPNFFKTFGLNGPEFYWNLSIGLHFRGAELVEKN